MKFFSILLVLMPLLFTSPMSKNDKVATPEDFKKILGMHTGSLSYKDYSSNEWVKIPLVGVTHMKKNKLVIEHIIYEWGSVIKQKYVYDIKNGSIYFGNSPSTLLEKEITEQGNRLKLVFTQRGKDGNDRKKCIFKHSLNYENNTLSITKEVKFDGEDEFFVRNQYELNKYK